ncbi:dsDNA nuclease domain-containing protein [Flavobacterium sp.]|uniref:dsDNA nuclease domain-containing protein n=1 Tax=Flavobacterium TaxID=237 RepID=UPI0031D535FB
MSLAKLHLFTKDTDATGAEQGFYFQKLITLRTWLQNRLEQNGTEIYCDYEEDIFERSLSKGSSTFRQVKLYSDNFSFSKEEITKSIAHFFMLYCKGEYALDNVTFVFETNSKPARQYKTGDPKLLQEWWRNQDNLPEQILERCRSKVKSIIDQYISSVMSAKFSPEIENAIKDAKEIYDRLPDEVWNNFIKSIRWKFDAIPQQDAIPQLVNELEQLVVQLPFSLNPDRASTYISLLLAEIAARTAEKNAERKILTDQSLDVLLLNMGSEKDRWYALLYKKWKEAAKINDFRVGEFYEIIAAAKHCRWELCQTDHDGLWLDLLKHYIDLEQTFTSCRRKAVYEYIFLLLSPDSKTFTVKNTIEGTENLISYYFENLDDRNSFSDLEDDIILLEIAAKYSLTFPELIKSQDVENWRNSIYKVISSRISKHNNTDELCLALQLMGNFHFHNDPSASMLQKTAGAVEFYRKIPDLLEQAKTYSIATLNNQSEGILNILIRQEVEIQAVHTLEVFLQSIEKLAGEKGQNLAAAKILLQRSFTYLSRPSSNNYLAALACLHKAKDNCNHDDGRAYLIIVLNNISKVYLDLGMNLAAKYYALSAVWACVHFGDYGALKLMGESYASVFDADYRQGSWISALDNIQNYLYARFEFNADYIDVNKDIVFGNALADTAIILIAGPVIHSELQGFLQFQKQKLGWIYTEFLQGAGRGVESELRDINTLKELLQKKLSMAPFSDIGPVRKIEFETYGIGWKIAFSNEAEMTAIAEEFTALLQIILCEIGLLGADLHLLQMPITIHLDQNQEYTHNLKQRMSHDEAVWDLAIPAFKDIGQQNVQYHYAFLATCIKILLSNISLLPSKEFYGAFDALYTKQNLGHKGLILNGFQKVYFNLVSQEEFKESRRSDFNPVSFNDFDPQTLKLDIKIEDLSVKYDQASSLAKISEHYRSANTSLSVSLKIWKRDPDFKALVNSMRSTGFLDWQILSALSNFVIAIKANIILQKNPPSTQQEASALKTKLSAEMRIQLEDQNYIPIPVEWLRSPELSFYIDKLPVDILESFGLENGMKYPNFRAVRSYLSRRLGFGSDDDPTENPLKDL